VEAAFEADDSCEVLQEVFLDARRLLNRLQPDNQPAPKRVDGFGDPWQLRPVVGIE
jgi:hypothetical protein